MALNKNKISVSNNKKILLLNRIFTAISKIHLVDKCLILIMLVLMAQSAYVLLSNGASSVTTHPIDIIIRTSAASIFGYLLSANFAQHSSKPATNTTIAMLPQELNANITNKGDALQNRIGFALSESVSELELKGMNNEAPLLEEEKPVGINGLQIVTAASIALFCLIALILMRDFAVSSNIANASAIAVASQFRDFISGCVGFLIGCPTTKSGRR